MDSQMNEDSSKNAEEVSQPVRLSLHLIVKRHLPKEAETWSQDQILESLHDITHLRLDRENIGEIDSLELLGSKVTNIYLQQNCITAVKNLDCLPNLQFLTLAGNKIRTVENLCHLSCLLFLDLSDNSIEDFDIDEFPQSLIILNLKGNPCCDNHDYRGRIIQDLPSLKQLDGEEISKQEKLEAGFQILSVDDGNDEENAEGAEPTASKKSASETSSKPTLRTCWSKLPDIDVRMQDATNEMLLRSQNRMEERLQLHHQHMMEISNLRTKSKALFSSHKLPPR